LTFCQPSEGKKVNGEEMGGRSQGEVVCVCVREREIEREREKYHMVEAIKQRSN
jgi:hypothetical protein